MKNYRTLAFAVIALTSGLILASCGSKSAESSNPETLADSVSVAIENPDTVVVKADAVTEPLPEPAAEAAETLKADKAELERVAMSLMKSGGYGNIANLCTPALLKKIQSNEPVVGLLNIDLCTAVDYKHARIKKTNVEKGTVTFSVPCSEDGEDYTATWTFHCQKTPDGWRVASVN